MQRTLIITSVLALCSCASTEPTATRSEATTDSGRPLSAGLQSYDVQHYTLRNEIHVDDKAISGSSAIRFLALRDMDTLELDFDGLFTIDAIEDGDGPLEFTRVAGHTFL